jgi:hypothetical protein
VNFPVHLEEGRKFEVGHIYKITGENLGKNAKFSLKTS